MTGNLAMAPPFEASPGGSEVPGDDVGRAIGWTMRPFVGRNRELLTLRPAVEAALAGRGHLILFGGEAGIGKTRLAEELARGMVVRRAGAFWGRCHEGDGAPALSPWIQIVDVLMRRLGPDSIRAALGAAAPEVARVLPQSSGAHVMAVLPTVNDPFGTNPNGSKAFAIGWDRSGLRQAHAHEGVKIDADGSLDVEDLRSAGARWPVRSENCSAARADVEKGCAIGHILLTCVAFAVLFGVSSIAAAGSLSELFASPQFVHPGLGPLGPALASTVASTYPMSSASSSITYVYNRELDTVERLPGPLGPILGERAETVGQGQFDLTLAYSFVDLTTINGAPLDHLINARLVKGRFLFFPVPGGTTLRDGASRPCSPFVHVDLDIGSKQTSSRPASPTGSPRIST